jgi:hypothetical protein
MDSRWERTRSTDENKILGCFPEIRETPHNRSSKEKGGKGYEKTISLVGMGLFLFRWS